MNNINVERLYELGKGAKEIKQIIKAEEDKLKVFEEEAKKLLPKGYWYTCDIDSNWHKPKKYRIKNVSFGYDGDIYLTVKEVFKRKPWPTFTGEHSFSLSRFLNLAIYKTEEEALHRPCPKCGGAMMSSRYKWCIKCMAERDKIAHDFDEKHKFYDPIKKHFVNVRYEDELTHSCSKGYDGARFVIRRIDTNEVIYTTNLFSVGYGENINNLPEIEFLEGDT